MRVTGQRERILVAVAGLGHGTPEEILAVVNGDGGSVLPSSTIYRALDALEDAGAVRHTHIDPRSPSYQLDTHDDHVHLRCSTCGRLGEVPVSVLDGVAEAIEGQSGYQVDLTHIALHGRCPQCRTS
jgi:Fur family ferric uptake transcriptional regulator